MTQHKGDRYMAIVGTSRKYDLGYHKYAIDAAWTARAILRADGWCCCTNYMLRCNSSVGKHCTVGKYNEQYDWTEQHTHSADGVTYT